MSKYDARSSVSYASVNIGQLLNYVICADLQMAPTSTAAAPEPEKKPQLAQATSTTRKQHTMADIFALQRDIDAMRAERDENHRIMMPFFLGR